MALIGRLRIDDPLKSTKPQRNGGFAIAIGPYRFALQQRTFVVTRCDLPQPVHLTLCWDNDSAEVDLHLKFEKSAKQPCKYIPLLKFKEEQAAAFGHRVYCALEQSYSSMLSAWKRVTPGWLWRKRYWVLLPETSTIKGSLLSVAPKRRGKYRVDLGSIERLDWMRSIAGSSYRPQALNYLDESQSADPISAVRRRGGKAQVLQLIRLRMPNGAFEWRATTQARLNDLANLALLRVMEVIAIDASRPRIAEVLPIIERELALDREEPTRKLMEGLRQFATRPSPAIERLRRRIPSNLLR